MKQINPENKFFNISQDELHVEPFRNLTPPYFKEFLGEWSPDPRQWELHDRLQKYYDDTGDGVSNKDALLEWKEFKRWCSYGGYTQEEISKAKRAKFKM